MYVAKIEYRKVNSSFGHNGHHFEYRTQREEVPLYKGVFGYVDFPFEFRCVLGLKRNIVGITTIAFL